jgi:ATP-binding cassette subfamily B protein
MSEVLSGIRVIKNFLLYEVERSRFETINNDYLRKNLSATRLWGLLFPLIGFLGSFGTLLVMWMGGYLLMKQRISLGDFIALNTYYTMLMWPVAALGWILNLYQRGTASIRRVEEIFSYEKEREDGVDLRHVAGNIVFSGVSVSKGGRDIVKDVSFSLRAGEKLLVIGPTGSGKSTLLNLVIGLESDYSGRISVDGQDIRRLSLSALRRSIAIVPQEPFLYSLSILDNVVGEISGDHWERRKKSSEHSPLSSLPQKDGAGRTFGDIDLLMETVNMKGEISKFEAGLNTVVGERGILISGGQKQRLTLARALATNPGILLLDDPLTHVDAYTEHLIWQNLSSFFRDLAVIVVSSRPVPLTFINQVIVLSGGSVADQGEPGDLLTRNPYMRLLYEVKG